MSDESGIDPSKTEWQVGPSAPDVTVGNQLIADIRKVAAEQFPHLADLFPFRMNWESRWVKGENWLAVEVRERHGGSIPVCNALLEGTVATTISELMMRTALPSYDDIKAAMTYSFTQFGYIGPYRDGKISYPHFLSIVNAWLSFDVVPTVSARNRDRVLAAVPPPPSYRPDEILSNVYILESEQESVQGTCFHMRGVGLVTCAHVLAAGMVLIDRNLVSKRYPIKVVKSHPVIDLALIEAPGLTLREGIEHGSGEAIRQMDHVLLAGFPRYRMGDTGIVSPGLVTGFRPVSTIRRLLVNAGIVAGNSGGPVLNGNGAVIGVAVTGADLQENVDSTENHGVIPIEALTLL
jgi:S1-C subfamily serine protease